jgi:hypothetical protein
VPNDAIDMSWLRVWQDSDFLHVANLVAVSSGASAWSVQDHRLGTYRSSVDSWSRTLPNPTKNFDISDSGYHGHNTTAPHAHMVAQYRWNNHNGTVNASMTVAVIHANDYVPTSYNQAVTSTGGDGDHDHGSAGEHIHSVTGFDNESRPPNVYVYWLIKFA